MGGQTDRLAKLGKRRRREKKAEDEEALAAQSHLKRMKEQGRNREKERRERGMEGRKKELEGEVFLKWIDRYMCTTWSRCRYRKNSQAHAMTLLNVLYSFFRGSGVKILFRSRTQ